MLRWRQAWPEMANSNGGLRAAACSGGGDVQYLIMTAGVATALP